MRSASVIFSQPCKNSERKIKYAPVAELADAYGSGPYFREEVQVQFLSGAPRKARFYRAFFFFSSLKLLADAQPWGWDFLYIYYKFNSVKLCNCHNYKFIKVVRLPIILPLQYEIMLHTAFPVNLIMFYKFGFQINFYPQLFITLINFDFINQQP